MYKIHVITSFDPKTFGEVVNTRLVDGWAIWGAVNIIPDPVQGLGNVLFSVVLVKKEEDSANPSGGLPDSQ